MRTEYPKPLHKILGKPMICYLLESLRKAGLASPVVVAGYKNEVLKKTLPGVKIVEQKKALGSADALKTALKTLGGKAEDVLVVCCDTPFIHHETIGRLIRRHRVSKAGATVLTAVVSQPFGYGRIIRAVDEGIARIVEELDASEVERTINEVNVGAYCFDTAKIRWALRNVRPNNRKKEYYLTDAVMLLRERGAYVGAVQISSRDEMIGINSRSDLAEAARAKRDEITNKFMARGVTIVDPASTWISPDVKIGVDTVVRPHTVIEGNVSIGKRCSIGPFARLRPGVTIGNDVAIGNFVELSRTKVGDRTRIKHKSYLGDITIGKNVNVGAGFIVANYDGKHKNKSVIRDGAFIGVGSILIAPATVGKQAIVGAGCVITRNYTVPDRTTVVGVPARPLHKKRRK